MLLYTRFFYFPPLILVFGLVQLHATDLDLTNPLGQENELVLTGAFGEPRESDYHTGLDLLATHGQQVYSIADMQLTEIGYEKVGLGLYLKFFISEVETATQKSLQDKRTTNHLL